MKRIFNNFYQILIGKDVSLERKISNIFIMAVIIATTLALFVNILVGHPLWIIFPSIATLLICAAALIKRKGDNRISIVVALCFVSYIYVPFMYITMGMLYSTQAMFFVASLFVIALILRDKHRIIALTILIIEYTILLFIGAYYPQYEYDSPLSKGLDFSISFVIIAVIVFLVTFVVKFAYEEERQEVHSLNKELEAMALIDTLTGCHNRRYLKLNGESIIKEHKKNQTSLAALMVDLDHFKKINDTYGHSVGDEILRLAANTLRASVRLNDIMVRYGGEEFIVILPACDRENGLLIAERIRASMANSRHRVDISFTVSVGVAILDDNDTLDSLVDRADTKLYEAKNGGRNLVVI